MDTTSLAKSLLYATTMLPIAGGATPNVICIPTTRRKDSSGHQSTTVSPHKSSIKGSTVVQTSELDRICKMPLTEQDLNLGKLQQRIRAGDHHTIGMLAESIRKSFSNTKIASRELAIEALTACRAPELDNLNLELISWLMNSASDRLRYAAIAGAGDLPLAHKLALRPLIEDAAASAPGDARLQNAARAFLAIVGMESHV